MALRLLAAAALAAVVLFLARLLAARFAPTAPLVGLSFAALLGTIGALLSSMLVAMDFQLLTVGIPLGGLLGLLAAYQRQFRRFFVYFALFFTALVCVGSAWFQGELLATALSVAVAAYCYKLSSSAQVGH